MTTNVLLPQDVLTLANFRSVFRPFGSITLKHFKVIRLSNISTSSVPDEGYFRNVPDEGYFRNVPDEGCFRNASCALN